MIVGRVEDVLSIRERTPVAPVARAEGRRESRRARRRRQVGVGSG